MRIPVGVVVLGLILMLLALPVAATDNAKWFVCKYTGTPGVDEVLQTGDNPISVAAAAIGVSPVVPGAWFADSQGRSYVLVEDTGQPEPDPSLCPPPNTSSPTPTPSPSASASQPSSFSLPPSANPTPNGSQPTVEAFAVEVCPLTGEPVAGLSAIGMTAQVPPGMSAIRFEHPILLLAILNVRIDGELVTLDTFGDVIVTPGTHTWSISNPADTEVLASGEVDCPVCDPAAPSVDAAPPEPSVTPATPDTALPQTVRGIGFVAGVMLALLGVLLLFNALSVRRRR